MDIGSKLKELRQLNNLTLEELASRSELTKGFLSQVERNLTSPSISTLEDILEALGTSLSSFFAEQKEEQIVFQTQDFFVDEREDHTVEWIVPNAQKNDMEPILLTLPQGGKSQKMNAHSGQEFGYVLQGEVQMTLADKTYTIKEKETFYLDGKQCHYLENKQKKEAKVLWITNPPCF